MHIDDNGYVRFTDRELAILNKTNPTLYSIAEWIANSPTIKNGERRIKKHMYETTISFLGNLPRCPISAIVRPYCYRGRGYCAGFVCSVKRNGNHVYPHPEGPSCLELRWKDVVENTTEHYQQMSYEERRELFNSNPVVIHPCIKVI